MGVASCEKGSMALGGVSFEVASIGLVPIGPACVAEGVVLVPSALEEEASSDTPKVYQSASTFSDKVSC